MSINNYEQLKSAVRLWSKRSDISDFIADFIKFAESRIDAGIRTKANEKRALATLSQDDKYIVLPSNFVEMRSLRLIHAGRYYDLMFTPPEAMKFSVEPRRPTSYTVNNKIEFNCEPDQDYQLEMTYYYGLTPLTTSNSSNNILALYPNLYLYGSLAELYRWALDYESAAYYDQLFAGALEMANSKEKKGRYGPAPAPVFEGRIP